ncbi:MAG: UbiX family flavin prenyltransferase [Lachnospiraceae bacterium]|nr:UbiX family flavin prenyltransferase [Lachnospiraceae bacterium]
MKTVLVGASGASGMPVLEDVLRILRKSKEHRSVLILSDGAEEVLRAECGDTADAVRNLADEVQDVHDICAPCASGTYDATGMIIVPCSMKTLAGIHSGYAENLLLRAADVTIKEKRPLVLGVRETPLSPIHLRNMHELSMLPQVHIMPLMMSFYHRPQTIGEMTRQMALRLLGPFGVGSGELLRWGAEKPR